jgi:peptidoglycan/LPS O-acetylase OafA/YrhL
MTAIREAPSVAIPPSVPAQPGRDTALAYLRAFIVALVVAHHSVIAYALYAPGIVAGPPSRPWLSGIPIADSHRLLAFDLMSFFDDIFFMSLMFLVSGLFVWPSLARKGRATFMRDRSLRLGLPFALAALLAPLAYYPAYRVGAADPGFAAFLRQWLSLASIGAWPSGPAWFVWVLLVFDGVAVGIHRFAAVPVAGLARLASGPLRRPTAFFAVLIAASAVAYLPMRVAFGAGSWVSAGPFAVQTSRSLLYLVYFLAGVVIGASGVERSMLARGGRLAAQWPVWVVAALALFGMNVALVAALPPQTTASGAPVLARGFAFVLCCGATAFAFMALFRRFANRRSRVFDSLSDNAYGIYLIHYGFVLWIQYALLRLSLPAAAKAAIVFAGALALSWSAIAALRRIPAVARVI